MMHNKQKYIDRPGHHKADHHGSSRHRPKDADAPIETLFAGQWLSLRHRGRWEFVERNNRRGAVVVIAITPDQRILFVEQYRIPINQFTIEMPAGLIGDLAGQEHEDAATAAIRELEEETGWRCGDVEWLHQGPSSAGMSTEQITFVRALDLIQTGVGGGDETENITVHSVPLEEVNAWLLARAHEGYSIDPKVFAGLWLLAHAPTAAPTSTT